MSIQAWKSDAREGPGSSPATGLSLAGVVPGLGGARPGGKRARSRQPRLRNRNRHCRQRPHRERR